EGKGYSAGARAEPSRPLKTFLDQRTTEAHRSAPHLTNNLTGSEPPEVSLWRRPSIICAYVVHYITLNML
ncbi:MAG: hypothetical protein WAM85_10240, partial [Terracidiphilus sp.]